MGVYLQFPGAWWAILAIIYVPNIFFFISRKSYKNSLEIKAQLISGFLSLGIAVVIEFIAITFKVWGYFPGNWPIVLWVTYFGVGMLGYQLAKEVEEFLGK